MAYTPGSDYTQADTSNRADSMRVTYEETVTNTMNRGVVGFALFGDPKPRHAPGSALKWKVVLRSPESVRAIGETDDLPTAGTIGETQGSIGVKTLTAKIQVTGLAQAKIDADGAWEAVTPELVEAISMDFKFDLGRQFHGDGLGILCEAATVTNPSGSDYLVTITETPSGTNTWNWRTTKNIRVGMRLAWGVYTGSSQFAAASPVADGYGVVKAVSKTAPYNQFTVVLLSGNAPAANDVFVRGEGTTEAKHAFGKEYDGLRSMVGTGNYASIAVADWPEWASKVDTSATERSLDDSLLTKNLRYVEDVTTGQTDALLLHGSTFDNLVYTLKANSNIQYSPMDYTEMGSSGKVYFNFYGRKIPFVIDRQAEEGVVHGLCREKFDRLYLAGKDLKNPGPEMSFDTRNGSVWKQVEGKDAAYAYMRAYGNLRCRQRDCQFRIEDIRVFDPVE